ncbi:MAG: hypothetical protein SPI77_03530 [Corynebacterium sp.]|nr:hypothetical protein [Corynebacterium sp.]
MERAVSHDPPGVPATCGFFLKREFGLDTKEDWDGCHGQATGGAMVRIGPDTTEEELEQVIQSVLG